MNSDLIIPSENDLTDLIKAFDEIQMARPPYVLEKMVVGSKFTDEQKYAQCVLELSIKYDDLRTAKARAEIAEIEMNEIDITTKKGQLEKEVKQIELEQLRRAWLGAYREFSFLYELWKKFPIKFNREQMNIAQEMEYKMRLQTQAQHDMNATGRIGVGNQEGLRQVGILTYPELDIGRDTEKRYLETGICRMIIAVATDKQLPENKKDIPCIANLEYPIGCEIMLHNSYGRPVADNYNNIAEFALDQRASYVCTVEDDTFPPPDAIVKLLELLRKNPKSAVGAWYPKKEESRQGVHIILKDEQRQQLSDKKEIEKCFNSSLREYWKVVDEKELTDEDKENLEKNMKQNCIRYKTIHEVYTLAMGCSIYPIEMFMKIPFPWFMTTASLSQDSFFSQLAREAGYKLLVDTSIKCKHIDRITGKVYE